MEDDLYPNDSSYFLPREPKDQILDRKKERAKTLEAAKVIDSVIDHFEERIKFRDSLEAIKPDLAKDPALHQKVCEVNDLLKIALIEEKNMLEELIDIYKR